MVTFDVCWIEGVADIRRVAGVQMVELPRRGDWIDLEYLPDEMFKQAFKGEEPHDVCNLAVEKVVHLAAPKVKSVGGLQRLLTQGPAADIEV